MRNQVLVHVSLGPGQSAGPEDDQPTGDLVLPPIPPARRELYGSVHRGVRTFRPWWRRRLVVAAQLAALIVFVSVVGGLIAGHFMLRYIQQ